MRFAIPLADGKLTNHFGHCASFAIIDIDPVTNAILDRNDLDAPPHQPGLLPPWLAEKGVAHIIAGGMGQRAKDLFSTHGIKVTIGAPNDTPEKLISQFMEGTLLIGNNACDH